MRERERRETIMIANNNNVIEITCNFKQLQQSNRDETGGEREKVLVCCQLNYIYMIFIHKK